MTDHRQNMGSLDRGGDLQYNYDLSGAGIGNDQRSVEPRKNYQLSDSGKYFGDIFSYTFDDTSNTRDPQSDNDIYGPRFYVPQISYASSGNEHGRTGSSLPDLSQPCDIPTSSPSTHSMNMDLPHVSPGPSNRYNSNTSPEDRGTMPNAMMPRDRMNHHQYPRHRCPRLTCSLAFGRKSDFDKHFRTAHSGRLSYVCSVSGCENNKGRGYSRVDKLREHQWKRHADSGFMRPASLIGDGISM